MGIRFTNEEDYNKFAEVIEEARKHNNSLDFFKKLIKDGESKEEKKDE